jgi:predicted nucleotidyltransferase
MQQAVSDIITPVLRETDGILGTGYSAVLYGSAARDEFLPGVSDVNLLFVCETLPPAGLRRLAPALRELHRRNQPPPLLIEAEEWRRASDVFPIELTDMRTAHAVLRGADPVAGLPVEASELRQALEQELRARLLRLRRIYAWHAEEPEELGQAAARTISSVAALLRGGLALTGQPVPVPTPVALAAAGKALGVPVEGLVKLWLGRGGKPLKCSAQEFEEYLSAVTAAVRFIDQFRGGK